MVGAFKWSTRKTDNDDEFTQMKEDKTENNHD